MKSKRLGISIITLVISLICGLGFVSMPKEKVKAWAADSVTYDQYMLVDDGEGGKQPQKVSVDRKAGALSVDGVQVDGDDELSYVLGQENIVLQATTNPGFLLKGWYVVYENGSSVQGTTNGYIAITDEEQFINNNYISVGQFEEINKKASLTILQMADSIKVAPVFDYEYYSVYLKGIDGETEVAQSNVKYGDKVSISKTVADEVNIDALRMVSSQIDLEKCADHTTDSEHLNSCVNKYNFVKDSTGRTTKYEVVFEMSVFKDVTVELKYDNLYKVDIKLYLGDSQLVNTATEDEEFDRIFSCLSLTKDKVGDVDKERYFSKLSDTSYFVKKGANFEIAALQNYKNAGGYILYNLVSLDGSTTNFTTNLNNISANKVVEVKYDYTPYKVEFVGVDYLSDKTVQVNDDLIASDTKNLTVEHDKNKIDLDDSILEDNVGYTFEGFVKFDKSKSIYDDDDKITSFTLNLNEPKDVVIYVLYTKNKYSINLTKLTDVSLTNSSSSETVYPIASAKIGETVKTGTTISFDGFKIGDEITLELSLNAGFNVTAIDGMTKVEDKQVYTLTLDKDFLLGKNSSIDLDISAEKLKYSLTYKIAKYTVADSVDAMADISIDGRSDIEVIDQDGEYYEIVVEDLTYYQTLTLKAKAYGTGSNNQYFVFRRFTTDLKTAITAGLNISSETPATYSIPFTIYGESVVYVVYSQPSTQMEIRIESAPESAGISFVVNQVGSADPIYCIDGLYALVQNNAVTVTINGLVDNEKLFGYKFVNSELFTTADGVTLVPVYDSEQDSKTQYVFTPSSDDIYVLVLNIVKTEYKFVISSDIAGFKVGTNPYAKEISFDLTIENSAIEFEKLTGYYVKKVQFKNKLGLYEEYSIMNQSNTSRNGQVVNGKNYFSTYYYNILTTLKTGESKTEFQKIVEDYLITKTLDDDSEIEIIDVFMTFEIYQYDVSVKYVKFNNNNLDESSGNKLIYPQIKLIYNGSNEAVFENGDGEIIFKYIPYGADISLQVERGVSAGFRMSGWCDYYEYYKKVSGIVDSAEQDVKYDKTSVKEDFYIAYKVEFENYTVKLQYNNTMGVPLVNGSKEATVKMGDSITIVSNPILEKGYIYGKIKYNQVSYKEYSYVDETTFASDYSNLYIIDKGYVFKNISKIYNEELNYYTIEKSVVEHEAEELKITNLDVSNYFVDNGEILFEILYNSAEMTIDNVSKAIAKKDLEALDLVKVGLVEDDLAVYTIKATAGGVTRDIVENETKVTVNDLITIHIQINKAAINRNDNSKVYDLSRGLTLYGYPLTTNWSGLEFKSLGDGAYTISFQVSQNIKPEFANDKKITIEYGYQLKDPKTVKVTTNVADSEDFVSETELKINEKTTEFETGILSMSYSFLTELKLQLLLHDLEKYFVINSITAYKGLEELEKNKIENLNSWNIKPNDVKETGSDRRVIVDVDMVMLDSDITICFNVQPRIYIEGEEIITQPQKLITRTYQFEVKNGVIEGIAQEITLGTDERTYDIAGYGIDPSIMEVVALQGGSKLDNGAINEGDYDLKLVFKDTATDEQKKNSWLYYIEELPCKLKLKINPLEIKIVADSIQFEKEYDSYSSFDLDLTKEGTKLVSGNGKITLKGEDPNLKTFDLGMLSFADDYSAEIVMYNENNELASQRYITKGNYANILITGLKLKNNTNFKLKFEEYSYNDGSNNIEQVEGVLVEDVIKIIPKVVNILNLEVYDKVYDENANAKFGLVEGSNKYIVEWVFTDDDVYLVPEEIKVYFANAAMSELVNIETIADASVGANKYVIIDARTALGGIHSENYVIGSLRNGVLNYKDRKTIYPAKLTTTVKGVGNVSLDNKRGLDDYTKANLIPVDAVLSVERIEPNSAEYRDIANDISSFLSRRNVFAAGYKLVLTDKNGTEISINNELHLSLPSETELVNVLSLVGGNAKSIDYSADGANIIIDLSQIEEDISCFVLIQNRALLKAWQIVLIVVLSLVAAAGIGVAVFFIVRKRRLHNDKYDTI